MGAFLERHRRRHRLSLRQASERIAAVGGSSTHTTLMRIEQGRLEPGAAELLKIASAYELPTDWVVDALETGDAAAVATVDDIEALRLRGVEHWRHGEIPHAIQYAMSLREIEPKTPAERTIRQKAIIEFATCARGLGRLRFARSLLEDLLRESLEPQVAIRALVLGASVYRGLGISLLAEALLEKAEALVERDDERTLGWVLHQKAKLLSEAGKFAQADKVLSEVFRLYERTRESHNAIRANILRIQVLDGLGRASEALQLAKRIVDEARSGDMKQLEVHARLEHGRLLVSAGRSDEGIRELRVGLAEATLLGDSNAEFHAHYRLWKAYGAIGEESAADVALRAAKRLAKVLDEQTSEADELRKHLSTARALKHDR